ncbi:MAG TPA: CPBP family intramembrane glutamic endopeptidase [Rhizomicrobium sp.]|jgi:membrane protease YdiL (CAAX protease family)|nr:CPBP family intramembrane glutamic endopeptidase [Rhizomicrobium sp.]
MHRSSLGVAVYLILAFGLAWTAWGIPLALGVVPQSPLFQAFALAGAFAPALAAIVVRGWITREGFADAGLGLEPRRWVYYLLALAIPIVAALAVVFAAPTLGIARPAAAAPLDLAALILRSSAVSTVLTPFLWGEEFGWRGYLQLRLFPESPVAAAIGTGIIWGVWHYPLLMTGTELPGHPLLILLLPVGTVFYSIVFGWLRLRSRSIWTASLAHSAVNNLRSPLIALFFVSTPDKVASRSWGSLRSASSPS